ncbi:MAG: hypothetical protein QG639_261 [Patescibacteria group bacterium]|nr:hypothetical protein [Patescibacteria group bacterium]
MTTTKAIAPIVKKALEQNRDARDSYNMLFICVMAEYGIHLDPEQRKSFLEMPSVTSIDRAARKIWESHNELRPTKKIQARRASLQNEYRQEMKTHWVFDGNTAKEVAL